MAEHSLERRRVTGARLLRVLKKLAIGVLAAFALWIVGIVTLASVLPPVSTLMLARWLTLNPVERSFVPIEGISPHLQAMVIASEDGRFCLHWGVDWGALREVILEAEEGGPARGASTITMQTAKNLLLVPSRSYIRKGLEIPLALLLDLVWSKSHILEVYLNIAEWGDGVFGAEAASQFYFDAGARQITARQASLLATALPSPLRRNPAMPTRGHSRLAAMLRSRVSAAPLGCLAQETTKTLSFGRATDYRARLLFPDPRDRLT